MPVTEKVYTVYGVNQSDVGGPPHWGFFTGDPKDIRAWVEELHPNWPFGEMRVVKIRHVVADDVQKLREARAAKERADAILAEAQK